jgi:hypothetical protein
MHTKTLTFTYADGTSKSFDVIRVWGSLFDIPGHFQIKREIERIMNDDSTIVLSLNAPTLYRVAVKTGDAYHNETVATVSVSTV